MNAYKALQKLSRSMFPTVFTVLRLLLVVPATSATAERSFSLLRRLKTYLRTTMSAHRLNHLALLHCYQEEVDGLNVSELIKKFVNNAYRLSVFGKIK